MSFWDHFDELRAKLISCLYVFFGGFLGLYFLSPKILFWLKKPLFDHLPADKQYLYYTGLFENFFVHLKVAGYASLLFLSPVYFLLIWSFVRPALKTKEKKAVLPFVIAASFFFLIGAGFAYFVLFPAGVKYFLSYGSPSEVALLTLDSYVTLLLRILLGFGFCFQLPVALVLFVNLGVITVAQMRAQRRTAIMVVAVLSAFIAPPDAMSMVMLMAPLYILYEGSIFVASILNAKKYPKES